MIWQTARLSDVAPVPWRNGGGVTRELAVSPAQGEWRWRISVAEVESNGPFSRFEGIDRWFAVLKGAGVQLDVQGQTQRLDAGSAPFYFDGGDAIHCTLLNGRTQDFNLMVRRGATPARMLRISAPTVVVLDAAKTIAIYATNTAATVHVDAKALQVAPQSLAWVAVPGGAVVRIEANEALWMEIPT